MDITYKTELRELNELNFQRFDAKLEQRLAEQDSRWNARFVALEALLDKRFAELEARWDRRFGALEASLDMRFGEQDNRMSGLEAKIASVETRLTALETKVTAVDTRVAALDAKVDLRISELRTEIADQKAGLHRWLFMYWAGTVAPLAGLILALHAVG